MTTRISTDKGNARPIFIRSRAGTCGAGARTPRTGTVSMIGVAQLALGADVPVERPLPESRCASLANGDRCVPRVSWVVSQVSFRALDGTASIRAANAGSDSAPTDSGRRLGGPG